MKCIDIAQTFSHSALRILLAVSLVLGLAPAVAMADTTVGVKVEAPVQVSETVAIASEEEVADSNEPSTLDLVSQEAPVSSTASDKTHIAAEVPLAPSTATTETLLLDGLTFELDNTAKTATLTGWYSEAPKGDLSIPSQVNHGTNSYTVTSIGLSTNNLDQAVQANNTTNKPLGGVHIFFALSFAQ